MEDGDDEFGDLYADVEVEASSAMNGAPQFPQLQFVSAETDKQNSVLEASSDKEDKASGGIEFDEDDDDDDDLNIVLNSDDDSVRHGEGVTIGRANTKLRSGELEDEDDDNMDMEEFVGGKAVGKAGSGGDGINQDLVGGGKGAYNSHSMFKYLRSHSAAYASDLKGSGCGAATYLSGEDNGYCQRMGSRSMGPQSGQRFSLPRARNILDVNIDIFEQKPWKHPGADITDYFNFGLNEDAWKLYCNQVDEYRHRSSGTPASEPAQLMEIKAYGGGIEHEIVARDAWGKRETRQRKGQAIQVEDSNVERQSSMDVRRQLDRDSDVIEITILDPEEHCSESAKEGLSHHDGSIPEASNHRDVSGDDGKDHLSFSSASEDESVEGNHLEMEIYALKRSSNRRSSSKPVTKGSENHEIHRISDVYGHQCSRIDISGSGGTDEAIRTSDNTKERAGEDTCTTDPSMLVVDSSEAEKSPANHCKAFEGGTCIDRLKSHSHERRPWTISFSGLTPSTKPGYHLSEESKRPDDKREHGENRYHGRHTNPVHSNRNHVDSKCKLHDENDDSDSRRLADKRKPGDHRYHARCNSPVYKNRVRRDSKPKLHPENDDFCSRRPDDKRKPGEHRYHTRHHSPVYNHRSCGVSKLKALHENDDSFPMSDIGGTYDVGSTVGHFRRNERLHSLDPYDEGNISYSRELELPSGYYGERSSGYGDRDTLARDFHHEGYERFESKMDLCAFRSSEEEEYYGERRRYIEDDKMMARDWCHHERELAVEHVNFFSNQNSKYPSYLKYKRGAQWKRKGDDLHFRNKDEDDECFLEREYFDDIQGDKFRSLTYNDRERDDFERNFVKHVEYTRWEFRGPERNKRRPGSPSSELNHSLVKRDEDRYLRYKKGHSFTSRSSEESHINNDRWHDNMTPRSNLYGRHGRYRAQWTGRFRYDGSLDDSEPFDRENYTIDISDRVDMGRTRRHWQSEMQWKEDEVMLRNDDAKYCAERTSFRFEKVSRRKSLVSEHERDQVEESIGHPHVEGCKYKPGEGAINDKFERISNVTCEGSPEQRFQGSGDSLYSYLVDGSNNVEELLNDLKAEGRKYEQTREVKCGAKFDGPSNITRGGSHERSFMDGVDSRLVDGSDNVEELIHDSHAEICRYTQTRKVINGNKCSKTHGKSHERLAPSCRNSLDSHLVVGEGKSADKAEWNVGERKKQAWMDFDSCQSDKVEVKAVKTKGKDKGLDIEEGQILTQEVKIMKNDSGVHVNDVNDQNGKIGFDNSRILEAMAKMEKRRARFKEQITTTKNDSESTTKPTVVDSVQQRRARKRRWGGS